MNYKSLQKDLNNNNLAPVYLFTGKERFLANQFINLIKNKVISPNTSELNFSRFNDKEDKIGEILSQAETIPFMSEKRLIIIDEGVGLMETSSENIVNQVKEYLNNPTLTSVVIILSEKVDKRRLIYKALQEKAEIVEFKKLNYSELSSFLKKRFKKFNITIDNKTLKHLIERLNYFENDSASLQGINSDIENLIDFAGDNGTISIADIDEIIPESLEENVFKIIDLVVQGKLKGVSEILENLWEQGESPIALMGLLVYQLRNILKIKLLLREGIRQNQLAKRAGLRPFVVNKTSALAKQFSLERLLELYQEIAELDLNIKTGKIEPAAGLEVFLLKLFKKK